MTETTAVSWAGRSWGRAVEPTVGAVAERASIPVACGGWAETQAAYRLLAHERFGRRC